MPATKGFKEIFGKDYFEVSAFERVSRWVKFVPTDSQVGRFL